MAAPASAAGKKVDIANLRELRPATAPTSGRNPAAPAEPPGGKPSRWDKPPEPPKPEATASRFAPPRAAPTAAPPAPPTSPVAEEDELPFAEGLPFAAEPDGGEEEFPLDGFDAVPGFGEDDQLLPYPGDELDEAPHRGVPRTLVAAAAILAILLVGVLGFVMFRPGDNSNAAPPIIAADASPTKVAPPEVPATGDNDQQNKLIYDRVDSSNPGTGNTTLVTPGSEPIAPVPTTGNDNPIARVILPGGPVPQAPASGAGNAVDGGNSDVAMNDAGGEAIGPRKVRTVVVRPDGTIVSSDAAPAEGDAPASVDTAGPPIPQAPAVPPAPTNDDTAAIAGGRSGQELVITPTPGTGGGAAVPAVVARAEPPKPAPALPKPAPKVVATNDGGPIDLTRGRPAGNAAPAQQGQAVALAATGMMVQMSSQRSEDAAHATFRDLQARYSSLLGGYSEDIQRADLGDRGTYYRVRVGPFAPSDAQKLCDALKGAGGDCILAAR